MKMKNNLNILYEDNHVIVVVKEPNVLSQGDSTKDKDLLTMVKEYIKEKYNKPGNVYLGLVHRLDRPVGGVMVFAKTSKAAERLTKQIQNHTLKKEYYAVVCGKAKTSDHLVDKLLKDEKTNITKVDNRGKEAILDYELVDYKDNMSLVSIDLKTGRSHQIRVQFSSRNLPLYGDQKYNKNAKAKEQLALFSKKLTFKHPTTNEELSFELDLPNRYPFSLYKDQ
jgi:23S rRNA pseudouridine1911/1915/1917 synthase